MKKNWPPAPLFGEKLEALCRVLWVSLIRRDSEHAKKIMSQQQNEAVLEKAVEDLDYAVSLRNFRLAKQVIANLKEEGFDSAARALSLELATKTLYA